MADAVLEATLERITFASEETGYTVARVDTGRGGGDLVTVVGSLLGVQPGETIRMRGRWGRTRSTGGSSMSTTTRPCSPPPSRASGATSGPG
ncbi:YrrC family ATP-dependent DNA helicase [Actinosynnema sp. CA-248983]